MVNKAGPLIKDAFSIMKDVEKAGKMCKEEALSVWDGVRAKIDLVCIGAVKLLESLCCLDVNRFAKPEKPLTGSLPILFVLMLIILLYNAYVFGYMPMAGIGLNSRTSLLFHAWIFMVLSSFSQAVRTDPGTTPMDARWRDKENPPAEAKERKRCSDEARWCRKSNAYKPDRAHYCRVLKKGVLRMDHYCPWLGNTVGFKNQKFFFLFLLFTNAACAQLGISFITLLVQYTLPEITTFCLIGAEMLTGLLTCLLIPFFLFHLWLIARNTTTIEFCERMRTASEGGDEPAAGIPRYDLGIYRNFCQVLGSNPLLWLIPVGGPPGDGITFPVNPAYERALARAAESADAAEAEQGAASSDDPEATHPSACSSGSKRAEGETEVNEEVDYQDVEKGSHDVEEEEGGEETESSEEEGSLGAGSATGDDEGFLVWLNPEEFIEDLTIGCQFLGEKAEDCGRGSLICLLTSCVPTAWGRKTARRLASKQIASTFKRSFLPSSSLPESSRQSLPRGTPAVRIVSVHGASGALSSEEGEAGSESSASGDHSDGKGHFLSD